MDDMEDVKDMYKKFVAEGKTEKDAAKEAQRITGHSVVTGRRIKVRGPIHKTKRKWIYGEYDT